MAFEALGDRLGRIVKKIRGQATLNERNMDEMLQEVRKALLEADVNYDVVTDFIKEVKEEAKGQKVLDKVSPGDMVVKIVHDKMEGLLGDGDNDVCFRMDGKPTVLMMVGLQGTGKTTSAAKLAQLYERKNHKKVLLAALDVYRPAAIEQLINLGKKCDPEVETYSAPEKMPPEIAKEAYQKALSEKYDILILDTEIAPAFPDILFTLHTLQISIRFLSRHFLCVPGSSVACCMICRFYRFSFINQNFPLCLRNGSL